MSDPGILKSALFVDFDNIFIGLQRTDPRAAERFARDPLSWIAWLERAGSVAPEARAGSITPEARIGGVAPEARIRGVAPEARLGGVAPACGVNGDAPSEGAVRPPRRRLLVRRCYLNPQAFNRYRAFFIRSGFEVIDTPPLTGQGKTSADVHMVLDLVDALHHPTRFDEFIVFSGDADFTPLLLRLRKHDRRSVVLAIGYAAGAYRAACDHLIDQEVFVEEGLGIEAPAEPRSAEVAAAELTAERAEVLRRIGRRVRDVATMMGAVGAADLPQIYKEFPEFTSGENWLDFYSLRAMTEAVVAAAGDLAIVGDDAWRVEPRAERPAEPGAEGEAETSAPPPEPRYAEIRDFVVETVRSSAQPVVLGAMAHEVVRRFGEGVKSLDWQRSGSFKAFLERLGLDGVEIAPRIPGYLYDPAVHGDFDPGDLADPFAERHPELAELARSVANVTETPYLAPEQYAVVFAEIAKEVNENGFQLTRTSKAVRDRCAGKGISVARSHISFLLKGLSFSGYRFVDGEETPLAIGRKIVGNTVELCRRAQMELSEVEEEMVEEWLVGGLEDGGEAGEPGVGESSDAEHESAPPA